MVFNQSELGRNPVYIIMVNSWNNLRTLGSFSGEFDSTTEKLRDELRQNVLITCVMLLRMPLYHHLCSLGFTEKKTHTESMFSSRIFHRTLALFNKVPTVTYGKRAFAVPFMDN